MKIGLINTALDENAPPINLVYLATALKADGFEEVKIIDQTYNRRSILDQVQGLDYVGISAMTKHYNKAIGIAKKIKSQIGISCIVGGVHITAVPSSLSPYFSLGVIGEGERTICNVFKAIQEKGNIPPAKILNEMPGILYWDKDNRIQTASSELIKDLDKIPMPDFGLLDERYFQKKWIGWNEKTGRVMHITTSRGCKYNCLFCSTRRFWKTTRFHSEERVFAEINELVNRWDVDHIMIDDDLFASLFLPRLDNAIVLGLISFVVILGTIGTQGDDYVRLKPFDILRWGKNSRICETTNEFARMGLGDLSGNLVCKGKISVRALLYAIHLFQR